MLTMSDDVIQSFVALFFIFGKCYNLYASNANMTLVDLEVLINVFVSFSMISLCLMNEFYLIHAYVHFLCNFNALVPI